MAEVVIFHNPNCSTSKYAVSLAADLGVEVEERRYLLKAQRPSAEELAELVGQLEDPPTDLVRRDANFAKLGLADADVATADQVVAVLAEHPELLQRPVLVKEGRAIIGRPKDRVGPFLEG
jgi:arsenate reductase (glutaredoxin)